MAKARLAGKPEPTMASRHDMPLLPQYSRQGAFPPSPFAIFVKYAALAGLGIAYGLMLVFLPAEMIFVPMIPIGILLALILWMLPDFGTYPERTLDNFFFFYLASYCLWPAYVSISLPGLPWLGLARFALFGLAALALWCAATSSDFRRQTMAIAKTSKPVYWMVIGYALISFVTIPFAPNIDSAIKRAIDNLLGFTLVFFISCFVLSKRGYPSRFAHWFVALGLIMAAIGVAEAFKEAVLWGNSIPSWLKVEGRYIDTVLSTQARFSDGLYRVRGSFTVSLSLAEFLLLPLPFLLHFIMTEKSQLRRALLIAGWAATLVTIFYTRSRLGIVGVLGTHAIYFFIWSLRRRTRHGRDLVGASLLYGFPIILLFVFALIASSNRLQTMTIGGAQHGASNDARARQREMAWPKVLANPLGHGGAQSGTVLGFKAPSGLVTVDSHFITTLLDFGVIGFVCWYGFMLTGAGIGYRVYLTTEDDEQLLAGPAAVALVTFFVGKSVLSQEETHSLIFMLVPMVLALRAQQLGTADRPSGRAI